MVVHEKGHAALCDFGLSRLYAIEDNDEKTPEPEGQLASEPRVMVSTGLTTAAGGTIRYSAPEQFLDENDVYKATLASDIYSFGCTCTEVLVYNQNHRQSGFG